MKKIYTSIDIGTETIRILVSEYFQGKLRTLAVSSVRSKGIKNGEILDEDKLVERIKLAIDDINSRIDVNVKKAILTIPPLGAEFNLVHGNVPIVNPEKMVTHKDIVRVQNSVINDISLNMELVSVLPIDFTIYENGSEIETLKDPVNKICDRLSIRAMVVTVPKTVVISYAKAVEKAGIEVVDLALSTVCDFEEVKTDDLENGTIGMINIGKDNTYVSVFNKGIITNSSVIKVGSNIIDDDISYVYSLNKKDARKIKENFGVAHPNYANKSESYDTKDNNDKSISINQYEISEIINKRLTEILNIAKNELKVLTNKQIRYIMVLGGMMDIPGVNFAIEDVLGINAGTYTMNTLGIRKSRFITSSGAIKHFIKKIKLRGKDYSMFNSEDVENLVYSKTRIGRSDSVFGRIVSYFFDN